MKGVGQESQAEGEKERQAQREDRQAGWWYQLMQSSQVYIDPTAEGCKFVKSDKRRKSAERRRQLPAPPPSREGVVEGAESSSSSSSSGSESGPSRGGRLAWMGSPPESVVNQESHGKPAKAAVGGVQEEVQEVQEVEPSSQGQGLRWGRLFGAGVGSPSKADGGEQRSRAAPLSRPPSGWLALDLSGLSGLVAQTIGAGVGKKSESPATPTQSQATPPLRLAPPTDAKPREVRALCHHIATEPGQLSFNKGDIMQVVQRADPDWLLCSLGSCQGLVPIVYVTLREMEESLSASRLGAGQC